MNGDSSVVPVDSPRVALPALNSTAAPTDEIGIRLHQLFDEILKRSGDERTGFLAAACPDIRDRALVERLLMQDELAGKEGFLDVHLWVGTQPLKELRRPEQALHGRRVGPYEVREWIASGGMGSVYRAVRVNDFRQQVAIKFVRTDCETESLLARFGTERQALAELDHPHIARILDAGTSNDGRPYCVMEFVDGHPIDRYCEDRQISLRDRVELFLQVCEAVEHAHQRGVAHRDLKPANILVTSDRGVKLTDFGIARLREQDVGLTQTGDVIGTPSYMSPEQSRGDPRADGYLCDVFALGAILYELLTGRLAFKGAHWQETLEQVCRGEPARPRSLQRNLPRDLETITLKCLHKEPQRRYANVSALVDDVRRYLAGRPIAARRTGTIEHVTRWCRRHPLVAWSIVAVVLLAIFSCWGALRFREMRIAKDVEHLTAMLLDARSSRVPDIVERLYALQPDSKKYLQAKLKQSPPQASESLRLTLALARMDSEYAAKLVPELLRSERDMFPILMDALWDHRDRILSDLWPLAENDAEPDTRLRAYCALATMNPNDRRWDDEAGPLVDLILSSDGFLIGGWSEVLKPVADKLFAPIAEQIALSPIFGARFKRSLNVYLALSGDSPFARRVLADRLALERNRRALAGDDRVEQARAQIAVALLRLGDYTLARQSLDYSHEPIARNYAIFGLERAGIAPHDVYQWLQIDSSASVRQALLLAIGNYDRAGIPKSLVDAITRFAARLYREDPDAGVHAAAEWLLRKWKNNKILVKLDGGPGQQQPSSLASQPDRNWYQDRFGNTFVIFRGPNTVVMGPSKDAQQRTMVLGHSFAVASTEVSIGQFEEFTAEHPHAEPPNQAGQDRRQRAEAQCMVSWYVAAFYCNWLSQREKLPPAQWCYVPNEGGLYSNGMRLAPNFVDRAGYRLPMEAEWLVACGASEDDVYHFGKSDILLSEYGWSSRKKTSKNPPYIVGLLKPNRHGLFDLHGNLFEWCLDRFDQEPEYDVRNGEEIKNENGRCLRGGSYNDLPRCHTLAFRNFDLPLAIGDGGIRLVRSIRSAATN